MTVSNVKMQQPAGKAVKPYKGPAMEGMVARWYAKIRNDDPQHAQICRAVSARVPAGGRILEIAPGPGYLTIELAKLNKYSIVGLDISHTFVQIATDKAKAAGVHIDFQQGNAAAMPLDPEQFDFILCVAAFKNFTEPVQAICEMYRVLKPGGTALINDLRGDASQADVAAMVASMHLNPVNKFMTNWTFKAFLLKNAYTPAQMEQMVAQTEFGRARIDQDLVSMDVWLDKASAG